MVTVPRMTNVCLKYSNILSCFFAMCNTWPTDTPKWTTESYKALINTGRTGIVPKVTLHQCIANSNRFPIKFPVESVRCKTLVDNTSEDVLESNINSAYPVVHEEVLSFYVQFLEHKRKFGTSAEKKLYQNMTLEKLIDRLLTKRAVMFVDSSDEYMLIDGFMGTDGWEKIGTPEEKDPLVLKNCLSYDEVKLSALLSVSSYTEFINIGDRNNCGKVERDENRIERNGVIVGLIGARFEKQGVMEYQEVVVTKEQNTVANGYGKVSPPTTKTLFFNFYEEPCLTYDQLKDHVDEKKFTQIRKGVYFNNVIYEKRLALSIDTLLIEANARAEAAGKMAFVHVVGIGLGVWRISQHQEAAFMDTFAKRIEFLLPNLNNVGNVCFAYIRHASCGKYKDGDTVPSKGHKSGGIRIHIRDRDPHEKLKEDCEGHLLVVSYAWDGNSLPGNEFWIGQLSASGDPAAAASTQISEIHNAHINPRVCGANLRVATPEGLLTLAEYRARVRELYEKSNERGKCESKSE